MAVLILGLGPTSLGALAFEHADRPAGLGIHHFAADLRKSAALAQRVSGRLATGYHVDRGDEKGR